MTLTEYRTRLRLLRLVERVDSGSNLLAAALAAGFGSYSQCHRAFTRAFGCAPRRFFGGALRREIVEAFAPWWGTGAAGQRPLPDQSRGDAFAPRRRSAAQISGPALTIVDEHG